MEKEFILQAFKKALKELYTEDYHLIENKTSERSIIATLACNLKQYLVFKDYKIDIEYNREGNNNDPKKDNNGKSTTADLIIHKTRGDEYNGNLVYLEAKTYYNLSEKNKLEDLEAIEYFTNKFNYEYGVFLYFGKTLEESYFQIKTKNSKNFCLVSLN